ncbi:MAG: hybrid sensor histidine kinase/response regulator, partial [Nitrospinota bacterium]
AQRSYALPVEYVHTTRLVAPSDILTVQGRKAILQEGKPISLVPLADLLEIQTAKAVPASSQGEKLPCVILALGGERLGLLVDALLDEQEVVIKPHVPLLKRVRNVSGATILGSGEVCIVLHPPDLLKSAQKRVPASAPPPRREEQRKTPVVLLVEDSITTRTQEKRILEGAGYRVITAVDGVDAFQKLSMHPVDAVVSDIQMPHMDGLTLTARIRQQKKYQELPIILVTSLATEEDKKRGIEAGANAYITKPSFNQTILLDTLRRLI